MQEVFTCLQSNMSSLNNERKEHLKLIRDLPVEDVVELCNSAFECLTNGPNKRRYELFADKYDTKVSVVSHAIDALISVLIDVTKANPDEKELSKLQIDGFSEDVIAYVRQFVTSKRAFIEASIQSAYIRAYRFVHMEWRVEVRLASRSLLQQCNVFATMKMYLHMEPKHENKDLIELGVKDLINDSEKFNRKDILVETDLNSLVHIIRVLEEALYEAKSRRVKNIVDALH